MQGMTRNVRKAPWFKDVSGMLDEAGADWSLQNPTGRGHPKLIATLRGKKLSSPIPSSMHSRSNPAYLVARVRRFLSEAAA